MVALHKNINKIRIYSFSSFINKSFFIVPLYFYRLPHKLKKNNVKSVKGLKHYKIRLNKKNFYKAMLIKKTQFRIKLIRYKLYKLVKLTAQSVKNKKLLKLSKKKIVLTLKSIRKSLKLKHNQYKHILSLLRKSSLNLS